MKPEMFGNKMHNLLGHYSGPWAVRTKAKEIGIKIPPGKEPEVIKRLRTEIRFRKRQLDNDEFAKIVAAVS